MNQRLGTVDNPADLRALPTQALASFADELRNFILNSVSATGGHLSANLGTVELTIALHYVFDTPDDRIIWDVGHQAYAHKILTERRAQMGTIRQFGGISGFPDAVNPLTTVLAPPTPAPRSRPRWAWPLPPAITRARGIASR
ncbi:1-deoxy-D-xylulose-5-phosphate synthase N-terminal domain-containing protein [Pseudomonas sp. RTB3]|nr:1-deoxy-D-xylulose-5-phosphate synthase N-terminal domain-containing protein [Pseudomonas sp. RTB3]